MPLTLYFFLSVLVKDLCSPVSSRACPGQGDFIKGKHFASESSKDGLLLFKTLICSLQNWQYLIGADVGGEW